MTAAPEIVPDTQYRGVLTVLPPTLRDLALLARFDRPIGWWLLFWPCAWAFSSRAAPGDGAWRRGSCSVPSRCAGQGASTTISWMPISMRAWRGPPRGPLQAALFPGKSRGAGSSPCAASASSSCCNCAGKRSSWRWAVCELVAAYPFMKRITGWPQAWLGLVFTWGAPVGWIEVTGFSRLAPLGLLYAGCWAWCMAYDTIYALQDREDDAMVGIGSSALSFGRHVRAGVIGLYAMAAARWAGTIWLVRPDAVALVALLPVALHFAWQALTLDTADGLSALARFRSEPIRGRADGRRMLGRGRGRVGCN
jgi:4-hydroxybenzoate polyprenyltransferase